MAIPTPGKPVRGSRTGQPIMALFDLLGRSWAMGVIWNLSKGACTFRELQDRCESVSPTTLNKRLRELTEARIIERTIDGYSLTRSGTELFTHLKAIGAWAKRWSRHFK